MRLKLFPHVNDTLFGVSTAIRLRQITCREVFERCRAAVAEQEDSVKAWVLFGGDEVESAVEARDSELKQGIWRGPLHGIPVGVKDIYDVAGQPTLAGIPNFAAENVQRDSTMVARLKAAGAIVAGKTVTTAYAYFDPPPTRNPWNLDRTPGGSSSGSAAAVATGMCLGALGSQTGGSITRPASFCGIAGYKPTFGLLNRNGVFPLSPSLDHPGPLARTVADLICLMTALAPQRLRTQFRALLNESSLDLRTLNLQHFEPGFAGKTESAMRSALHECEHQLVSQGATVDQLLWDVLDLPQVWRHHRTVMAVDIAQLQSERLKQCPEQFTPAVRTLIEEGRATSATAYAAARQFQLSLRRTARNAIGESIWLLPAARGTAPTLETTGDPCMNSPWSFLGFPTITIPMAQSPDSLPLGLQLVAGPGRDIHLFRVARGCENALKTFLAGK